MRSERELGAEHGLTLQTGALPHEQVVVVALEQIRYSRNFFSITHLFAFAHTRGKHPHQQGSQTKRHFAEDSRTSPCSTQKVALRI